MNKQEIIEAINSTIVANGQKGITAESLANLLIEMASATPESSGGSGGLIFYQGLPNEDFTEFSLTEEERAHNVNMYNTFVSKPCGSVSFDLTRFYVEMVGAEEGLDLNADEFKFIMTLTEVMYISESLAQELDAPFSGIVDQTEGLCVTSDGSVITLSNQ